MSDTTLVPAQALSMASFYSMFASLEDGLIFLDKELKLTFFNQPGYDSLFNAYGICPQLGEPIVPLMPEHRREAVHTVLKQVLKGEIVRYEIEVPQKDGASVWLSCQYFPISQSEGSISNICVMLRDISDRKRLIEAEKEILQIEENRKLFEHYLEHTPLVAWIYDEQERFVYANQLLYNYFKLPDGKDIIGKEPAELYEPELAKAYHDSNKKVLDHNQPYETIEATLRADGTYGTVQVCKFPLILGEKRFIGGWAIDITEKLKLQEQILKQERENKYRMVKSIIETQELERRLFSIELHDNVNQTLASCKLVLEMALQRYGAAEPLVQKTHENLQEVISKIKNISQQLNPYALIDLGMKEAIIELLNQYQPLVQPKISFDYCVDDSIDSFTIEEQTSIYRIIQKQLSNIILHANAKSAIIRLHIKEKQVRIFVEDDGVGFDLATAPKNSGFGDIYNRVEYLKGSIHIDTAKGKGCRLEASFTK